ncbi:FtsX-like permease family protein [Microbacterium dauci]|uniref:FAD-binding PCMH-type domain-containing protein n=1 Tax=Microbacterium dauci TaxID=3048008 RepID=A0ABT6ZGU7_9MICO|nr:FtsX-like permease family protein [Microbacterium sp. LX3-4]MDJ1115374.1 hypothetical protein [Microbacterium sp. LX3-4]
MTSSPPSVRPAARLFWARVRAQRGLLLSTAGTVAVAVATVGFTLSWLHDAATSTVDPGPGADPELVVSQVADGARALEAAAPALVILIVLGGATAVAQLGRLVGIARAHEDATLRARGLSRGQATLLALVEGVVVVGAGALTGTVAAAVFATLLGMPLSGIAAAAPGTAASALALLFVFALAIRRAGAARRARATRIASGSAVVLVLLAAGLVLWQLPSARSGVADPIAAAAPTVLLAAGAIVALAVFGLLATAWAPLAARGTAVQPGFSARQVSRTLPVAAVAVLLVALTTAQAVFVSAYAGTWEGATRDAAALRAGAAVRVDLDPQSLDPARLPEIAALEGVTAVAPATVQEVEIGDAVGELIALPTAAVADVIDTAGLRAADSLVPETEPVETIRLGADAETLQVRATLGAVEQPAIVEGDRAQVSAGLPTIRLTAILLDGTGAPVTLPLEDDRPLIRSGTVVLTAEASLPAGSAPWRLLAVIAGTPPGFGTRQVDVTIDDVVAGTELAVTGSATLETNGPDVVLWLAGPAASGALPVTVSAALAARTGVAEGDPLDLRYAGSGRRVDAVVASIIPAIPGAGTELAVFTPLESLLHSQLQRGSSIVAPNSVWVDAAPEAAASVSEILGDRPVLTAVADPGTRLVGALIPGWWIATVGSTILALIAVLASAQTLAHARRGEVAVLRALGLTATRQAAIRAGELTAVTATALLLGGLAGAGIGLIAVPELVRASTPGLGVIGATSMVFDLPPLAIALAALVAGLASVIAAAAAVTQRHARTATVTEGDR